VTRAARVRQHLLRARPPPALPTSSQPPHVRCVPWRSGLHPSSSSTFTSTPSATSHCTSVTSPPKAASSSSSITTSIPTAPTAPNPTVRSHPAACERACSEGPPHARTPLLYERPSHPSTGPRAYHTSHDEGNQGSCPPRSRGGRRAITTGRAQPSTLTTPHA
jgi:hypothetical protein